MSSRLPRQRWHFPQPNPQLVREISRNCGISPIMAQVIVNRGVTDLSSAHYYINPEQAQLPHPLQEFPHLSHCIDIVKQAIAKGEKIGICGDYDADGMTSTALLIRTLRHLGGIVDYAIPSRMKDGYGINERLVNEFHQQGFSLIITVDNGISAHPAIERAKELGLKVIITDHHDLPPTLPPADAILNPKLLPETSPYHCLAGVGVAYIFAISLAQSFGPLNGLTKGLLELYTIGTIADLVPLNGVNRRWLKRGLKLLANPDILGIRALSKCAGINESKTLLNTDDIGFILGPRINAIGRLDDPQIVIELLTTEEEEVAMEMAKKCEYTNRRRQEMCNVIEEEAVAIIERKPFLWQENRVIFLVNKKWHHGVIGIVASRLVERYGVPVFLATYEDEKGDYIRGSARGIEEYNVFSALQYCDDLLEKYGGHKAAGGFTFSSKKLELFHQRLIEFSLANIKPEHTKPLIKIDAQISLYQANLQLLREIESLYPWGVENKHPIFCSKKVKIKQQRITKDGQHLQLIVADETGEKKAIAWRWHPYFPLPPEVDIAYKIKEDEWQGNNSIQLELVGVRLPS
ncbi:MAG: single-stranded-DNA-specific exonuclease RecJ [Geminocystis sp.]|nr:single-stranded-DNA-specific exonuclease RecJ [Geminocystis sp.]